MVCGGPLLLLSVTKLELFPRKVGLISVYTCSFISSFIYYIPTYIYIYSLKYLFFIHLFVHLYYQMGTSTYSNMLSSSDKHYHLSGLSGRFQVPFYYDLQISLQSIVTTQPSTRPSSQEFQSIARKKKTDGYLVFPGTIQGLDPLTVEMLDTLMTVIQMSSMHLYQG